MKRIGILLLLLATVFAGCEKIKTHVDTVQDDIKLNISELLESNSDDPDTDSLDYTLTDPLKTGLKYDAFKDYPYSFGNQFPLYSPLKVDTTRGFENISPLYQWNYLTTPLWDTNSLNFSYSN